MQPDDQPPRPLPEWDYVRNRRAAAVVKGDDAVWREVIGEPAPVGEAVDAVLQRVDEENGHE